MGSVRGLHVPATTQAALTHLILNCPSSRFWPKFLFVDAWQRNYLDAIGLATGVTLSPPLALIALKQAKNVPQVDYRLKTRMLASKCAQWVTGELLARE
jgi:hypothetical protein